jgi:hypothetical protein
VAARGRRVSRHPEQGVLIAAASDGTATNDGGAFGDTCVGSIYL